VTPPARPRRRPHRRGRGPENDVVDLYLEAGYVAYRIAHGVADVVALRAGEPPVLVQVKSTAGGPYERFLPVDRAALLREARQAGARALLAWWPPRRPTPQWIGADDWPPTPEPPEWSNGDLRS